MVLSNSQRHFSALRNGSVKFAKALFRPPKWFCQIRKGIFPPSEMVLSNSQRHFSAFRNAFVNFAIAFFPCASNKMSSYFIHFPIFPFSHGHNQSGIQLSVNNDQQHFMECNMAYRQKLSCFYTVSPFPSLRHAYLPICLLPHLPAKRTPASIAHFHHYFLFFSIKPRNFSFSFTVHSHEVSTFVGTCK